MAAAIEIRNLTKQYPVPMKREAVNAVDKLDLTVGEGEIFGFLGANGAGKTTTIKILLGLIYPTEGDATVLGAPAGDIAVKHKISYLPESPYFYEHMTAREVVTFYAQLFGMKREDARRKSDELVDLVGLGGKSDVNKRIYEFSKGMRQRVGIAQSLINDPTLLFYDEPTSGLDAIARRDIRDLMLHLKGQGKTMFLSSHQLEDVEAVCHRVSIIHKGKLRILGSVEELLAGEHAEVALKGVSADLAQKLHPLSPEATVSDGRVTMILPNESGAIGQVLDLARANNASLVSVIPKRKTLEDLFVQIVGERISVVDGVATTVPVAGIRVDGEEPRFNVAGSTPDGGGGNAASYDAPAATSAGVATDTATTPRTRPTANKYKELNRK